MSDPNVRVLGYVKDIDDMRIVVGVDYDSVVIGPCRLGLDAAEEFARRMGEEALMDGD